MITLQAFAYETVKVFYVIKQVETVAHFQEVNRKMGISEPHSITGRRNMVGDSGLAKLKNLEEENSQLKKLVADLNLDKQILLHYGTHFWTLTLVLSAWPSMRQNGSREAMSSQ